MNVIEEVLRTAPGVVVGVVTFRLAVGQSRPERALRGAVTRRLAIRPAARPRRRFRPRTPMHAGWRAVLVAQETAAVGVTEMTGEKQRVRREERQQWATRFEKLAGEPWHAANDRAVEKAKRRAANEKRALEDICARESQAAGWRLRIEDVTAAAMKRTGWDGYHHMTCPYECDCPQDVRNVLVEAGMR